MIQKWVLVIPTLNQIAIGAHTPLHHRGDTETPRFWADHARGFMGGDRDVRLHVMVEKRAMKLLP